jgi:hypothetical protein
MVKPKVQARSSRVSDRPAFGFGASSFGGGFATVTSPLSYLTELPDTSKISDPHTVVIFKNLFKRDSTTKAKALEELQNLLSPSTGDTPVVEDAVLDIWVRIMISLSCISLEADNLRLPCIHALPLIAREECVCWLKLFKA